MRELARQRWMVLSPHPDDETLGTGGLLCTLADAGQPARVVYLTDGAASHPGSPSWPPARLSALRRREARGAVRTLCAGRQRQPVFLDWPDAAPHAPGSPGFEWSVSRLAALLRRDRVTALVTTWTHEPHCDHAAAAHLARTAARRVRRVRLYWCVVWGWSGIGSDALVRQRAIAIPPRPRHAVRRRQALARHRSQLGAVIGDSVKAFRLPPAMMRAATSQLLFGPERP